MRDGTYFWAGEATDIWVDAKTKRIVLVETTGAKGRVTYMLKDFVFDEELDDSLFSLELPEGYKQIPPPPIFSISPE
jgi:outer membrane lipoprotein-sorting protein